MTAVLPALVSPFNEMIAYETLWSLDKQSLKTIADLWRLHPGYPSDLLEGIKSENIDASPIDQKMATVAAYIKNIRGFSVCVHGTELYPDQLRSARHPLELFYYRGDIELALAKSISVVGARKCSPDGERRAARLARELVAAEYTIVSGLAEGIDTAAMKATIEAKGRVIGVIGTPINEYYPKKNQDLQETVARDHLLISQVAFYRYYSEPFSSKKRYFPERNETMAALSDATVIVEASETSGTHSQARACLDKGKPLFILNSCFENPAITWPSKYLTQGAIRIKETREVIEHLARGSHGTDKVDDA